MISNLILEQDVCYSQYPAPGDDYFADINYQDNWSYKFVNPYLYKYDWAVGCNPANLTTATTIPVNTCESIYTENPVTHYDDQYFRFPHNDQNYDDYAFYQSYASYVMYYSSTGTGEQLKQFACFHFLYFYYSEASACPHHPTRIALLCPDQVSDCYYYLISHNPNHFLQAAHNPTN